MRKEQLIRYAGNMEQLAEIRSYTVTQGPMDGIRMHHVNAGALMFTVMESRCMDILDMRYRGVPLNFLSKCGAVSRQHIDPIGPNFLRSISGGMLYTCGLNNVGNQAESEKGIDYFHGRMRLLPANKVRVEQQWSGDEYRLSVAGEMRQAGLFRENMLLRRTIETALNAKTVTIRNTVLNEGIAEEPLMLMFHVNIGFPILDENTELWVPTKHVYPMNEEAKANPELWQQLTDPIDGQEEAVYVHEMRADIHGLTHTMAYNPKVGLGLGISFQTRNLPKLLEWKSMGATDYVLGLQPTNCFAAGRDYEVAQGTLKMLAPQTAENFDITLTVIDGEEDRLAFLRKIEQCKSKTT